MSGRDRGLKRVFGVKKRVDPDEKRKLTYVRPEGSAQEIASTTTNTASGHTMAPKRWQERNS